MVCSQRSTSSQLSRRRAVGVLTRRSSPNGQALVKLPITPTTTSQRTSTASGQGKTKSMKSSDKPHLAALPPGSITAQPLDLNATSTATSLSLASAAVDPMPSNDISADFQLRLPNVAPLTIDVSSASTEEPASSITASEQSLLGSVRRKLRETRGRGGANCTGTTATPAQKPDRTETLRLNLDAVPVVEADAERKAVGQAAAAKRVRDFKRCAPSAPQPH
eukprot:6205217-Pleurochrysis_carterae.AAC.4